MIQLSMTIRHFTFLWIVFWCEVLNGDLVLKEHEAAKWLTKEKLNEVEWLPADITLIEEIRKGM